MNLPNVLSFGTANDISYVYDATGTKLEKRVTEASATVRTQYAGSFIYNDASGQMALQFFSHPEGYVEPLAEGQKVKGFDIGGPGLTYSSFRYVFQYKDHLGNVRLSYSDLDLNGAIDPDVEILDEKNYSLSAGSTRDITWPLTATIIPTVLAGRRKTTNLACNGWTLAQGTTTNGSAGG